MEKRFFLEGSDYNKEAGEFLLTGSEYNHMVNVMRMKEGDNAIICLGDGKDNLCQIVKISKGEARLKLLETVPNLTTPKTKITLYQAIPKGDKIELIVQKCTELGIYKIVPMLTDYTQVKENSNKIERLRKIAVEASKQCGRANASKIEETTTLIEAAKDLSGYDAIIMPYENEKEVSLKQVLRSLPSKEQGLSLAVFIGSEGGFSVKEVELIKSLGGHTATLGTRILRAETAAITTVAIIMHELEL